jgi:putative ABC transport system permease protein
MKALWKNLRYTLRVLGKSLGFLAVAVFSLALGIGANTAIFTLINALILRDLPVRQPGRLVKLTAIRPDGKVPFSYPMFREVERGQRVFTGIIGFGTAGIFNVEVNGVLSQNSGFGVTGNCYSELGVTPLLGRLLTPDDSNPSSGTTSQVVVIGYDFWQRRFAGVPDVVGKQIRIEGHPFTIVGVTERWFVGMTTGEPPDITIPITAYPPLVGGNKFTLDNRSLLWVFAVGRLKDGLTISQAQAQLQSFWPGVLLATASTETPGLRRQTFLSMGLDVSSASKGISEGLRDQFARPLYVLAGIVALILLVACVNLANLMLARAAARSHERSVRVALGASRWSLAGQVLMESLVLSLTGALLGLAFAYWGSHLLLLLMTQEVSVPVSLDLSPDPRVLLVTMAVAILTGILFGLVPAWHCSREDPGLELQQSTRSVSGRAGKLGKALIIAQVALSLILLVGAGLFLRSFQSLRSVNLGFPRERLLEISLNPVPGGYEKLDVSNYHKSLLDRVSRTPGVLSASFSTGTIPSSDTWHDAISPMAVDPANADHLITYATEVSPGFFQTLGVPFLQGRDFLPSDDEQHPHIAIVNASLAHSLFPHGDAVGKFVRFGFMPGYQNLEIVGTVSDTRIFNLQNASVPVIFFSTLQYPSGWGNLIVRTGESPESLTNVIGQEIESLGREYPLRTRTVAQVISHEHVQERVTAMLSGFFAALALLLASIGLYGLMAYAVTRRTREIGIRIALGAQRKNVLWLILQETLALTVLGIAIGIPSALVPTRLIAGMLFGVSPGDVPTIVGVSLLLVVVALFAGYLPARRASTIDPIVALRSE